MGVVLDGKVGMEVGGSRQKTTVTMWVTVWYLNQRIGVLFWFRDNCGSYGPWRLFRDF